ncbi:class 1 fructose-bisphosphatase [Rhodopila sp.]|uniref:class 1 fructose-bisphosphatase n=1 Tax=Rhodopila sp. TaxID=2480087 RepID=UPI003D0F6D08
MPYSRTTLSKFIIEDQRRSGATQPDLSSLLNDIQTACKLISLAVSRGVLDKSASGGSGLDGIADAIMRETCEWGGQLRGMASRRQHEPYKIPPPYPRGRCLLVFDPLEGMNNVDVNVPVGTLFSVLRCPDGVTEPAVADFLQPGTEQVAAGYAIYGPVAMIVLTLGAGVHGFTLDRDIGAYTLTHPDMLIPPATHECAINAANQRFWPAPVRRYVEECIEGSAGRRGDDVSLRWIACSVAEVHRILLRGGLLIDPPGPSDGLRLLHVANPMAMLVEQAGGAASTGRERILGIQPETIDQMIPVILGSRDEVERLIAYHGEHDRGEEPVFTTPLFNVRSLFTGAD